jgi:hypothetical protein
LPVPGREFYDAARRVVGDADGGLSEPVALHLGDHQLQMRDHRLSARSPGLAPCRTLGNKLGVQPIEIVGSGSGVVTGPIVSCAAARNVNLRSS